MEKSKMKYNSQFKYSRLLSDQHKKDLGPVNLNWFDELTVETVGSRDDCNWKEKDGEIRHQSTDAEELFSQYADKSVLFQHSSDTLVSPGLELEGKSCAAGDSLLDRLFALTPSYTTQEKSVARLFKTPGSVPKSHGKRLALSLGVDLHGAGNVSWTSSLATPRAATGTEKKDESKEMEDNVSFKMGAARALFSPGVQQDLSQDDLALGLNNTVDTESEEEFTHSHRGTKLLDFDPGSCMYKSTPAVQYKQSFTASGGTEGVCKDTENTSISAEKTELHEEHPHGTLFDDVTDLSRNDNTVIAGRNGSIGKYNSSTDTRGSCGKNVGHMKCDNVDVFEDVLSIFVSPVTQHSQSSLRLSRRASKRKLSMEAEVELEVDSQKSETSLLSRRESKRKLSMEAEVELEIDSQKSETSPGAAGSTSKKARLSISQSKENRKDSNKQQVLSQDIGRQSIWLSEQDLKCQVKDDNLNTVARTHPETEKQYKMTETVASEGTKDHTSHKSVLSIHDSPLPDGFSLNPSTPVVIGTKKSETIQECETIENIASKDLRDQACVASAQKSTDSIHNSPLADNFPQNSQTTVASKKQTAAGISENVVNKEVKDHISRYKSENCIHASPLPDIFTQISPTSLSAMYDAAEMTATGGSDGHSVDTVAGTEESIPMHKQYCDESKMGLMYFSQESNGSSMQAELSKLADSDAVAVTNTGHAAKTNMERSLYVSPLFSSNKPPNSSTPLKWKPKLATTKNSTDIPKDSDNTTNSAKPVESKSSLSLRNRKAKRFSYPSTSQISKVCPQRVFQFEEPMKQEMQKDRKSTAGPLVKEDVIVSGDNQSKVDPTGETLSQRMQGKVVEPDGNSCVLGKDSLTDHGNTKAEAESMSVKARSLPQRRSAGFTTLTTYNKISEDSRSLGTERLYPKPKAKTTEIGVQKMSDIQVKPVNAGQIENPNFDKQHVLCDVGFDKPSEIENSTLQHTKDTIVTIRDVRKHQSTGGFQGFTSGSGKLIQPSRKALERAQNLMEDIEKDMQKSNDQNDGQMNPCCSLNQEQTSAASSPVRSNKGAVDKSSLVRTSNETNLKVSNMNSFVGEGTNLNKDFPISDNVGFQFASGKTVSISDRARVEAESLMTDIEKEGTNLNKDFPINENVGFQFASGKTVSISDRARVKAESLMTDIEKEGTNLNNKDFPISKNVGFQFASGKTVSVSDRARVKAKSLMTDIEKDFHSEENSLQKKWTGISSNISDSENKSATSNGTVNAVVDKGLLKFRSGIEDNNIMTFNARCQSASEKYIKMKETALKAREKLTNEVEKQIDSPDVKPMNSDPFTEGSREISFESVIDKSVKMSDKAFQMANEMVDEIQKEVENKDLVDAESKPHSYEDKIPMNMHRVFQSTSGKSIQVSGEASKMADNMVHEARLECVDWVELKQRKLTLFADNMPASGHAGFQSASAKNIDVSEKAWESADRMVNETELKCDNIKQTVLAPLADKETTSNLHAGFRSASGNIIKVSKKALRMANKMVNEAQFECIDSSNTKLMGLTPSVDKDKMSSGLFAGFKSASGKTIQVSEKALKMANKMVDEAQSVCIDSLDTKLIGLTPSVDKDKMSSSPLAGFKSASGKTIQVSEKALKMANKMVDEAQSVCIDSLDTKLMGLTPSVDKDKMSSSPFAGFQSASGKNIKVSDKALKLADKMINDVQDQMEYSEPGVSGDARSVSSGFQSASGKGLTLSETSIYRAHLLMQEVHSEQQTADETQPVILTHNLENLENTVKELRNQSRGLSTSGRERNQGRDSVPQGFKPFKPPRMSKVPDRHTKKNSNESSCVKGSLNSDNMKDVHTDEKHGIVDHDRFNVENDTGIKKCNSPIKMLEYEPGLPENEDVDVTTANNGFTLTQMAEISEGTAAFLEFSQDTQHAFPQPLNLGDKDQCDSLCTESGRNDNDTSFSQSCTNVEFNVNGMPVSVETNQMVSADISEKSVQKARDFLEKEFSSEIVTADMKSEDSDRLHNIKEPELEQTNSSPKMHYNGTLSTHSTKDVIMEAEATPAFVGFKTASGKCINISEESLKQAQNIFEKGNDDFESSNVLQSETNTEVLLDIASKVPKEDSVGLLSELSSNTQSKSGSGKSISILEPGFNSSQCKERADTLEVNLADTVVLQSTEGQMQESGYVCTIPGKEDQKEMDQFVLPHVIGNKTFDENYALSKSMLLCLDQNDSGCIDMSGNFSLTNHGKTASSTDSFIQKKNEKCGKVPNAPKLEDHHNLKVRTTLQMCGTNNDTPELNVMLETGKSLAVIADTNSTSPYVDATDPGIKTNDSLFIDSFGQVPFDLEEKQCPGFQTASGKHVVISERSIQTAKAMLDESSNKLKASERKSEENSPLFSNCVNQGTIGFSNCSTNSIMGESFQNEHNAFSTALGVYPMSGGFQTASGKKVNVSRKALTSAKRLLEDEMDKSGESSDRHIQNLEACKSSAGFDTSSSKVTASVSLKTENYKSIDETQVLKRDKTVGSMSIDRGTFFVGFQTASGTKLNVSEKALNAARKMIQDDVDMLEPGETFRKAADPVESIAFASGMQKAGGAKVNVCEKAFEATKNMPASEVLKSDEMFSKNSNSVESSTVPGGFQTANGVKVNISEKALNAARKMIQDDVNMLEPDETFRKAADPGAFHTANGVKGNISEETLKSARSMLNDEMEVSKLNEPSSGGFQTGSGATVNISEKTTEKVVINKAELSQFARPVLDIGTVLVKREAVETVKSTSSNELDIMSEATFGFQTASGHRVKVSEKAMKAAEKLLNDASDVSAVAQNSDFGFQTASGHGVTVSEKAMKAAEKLINDASDVSTVAQNSDFGFQTASGHRVKVSEKAMKAAEKLLNDASDVSAAVAQNSDFGFQTASCNTVKEFHKANSAAEKVLTDNVPHLSPVAQINNSSSLESTIQKELDVSTEAQKTDFCHNETEASFGFQTANGNSVMVSANAMTEAKKLLTSVGVHESATPQKNDLCLHSFSLGRTSQKEFGKSKAAFGFQTASGNIVTVSDKAMSAAKKLLSDDESNVLMVPQKPDFCQQNSSETNINTLVPGDSVHKPINDDPDEHHPEDSERNNLSAFPLGFQTARGTEVKVSNKSIAMAKKFLDDSHSVEGNNLPPKAADKYSGGFLTTEGAEVNVTMESLSDAKSFLTGDPHSNEDDHFLHRAAGKYSIGFTTAGGNKVNVSANAMNAAKKLLSDDTDLLTTGDPSLNGTLSGTIPCGFQTASGAKVKVSQNALKVANKLLNEDDLSNASGSHLVQPQENKPSTSCAFQTASGAKVKVSQNALKVAKKLLNEDDSSNATESQLVQPQENKPSTSCVFQTASGGKVDISAEAFKASKKKLNDEEVPSLEDNVLKVVGESSGGFQTASRAAVSVPEDAVKAAQQILNEGGNPHGFENGCIDGEKLPSGQMQSKMEKCNQDGLSVPFEKENSQKKMKSKYDAAPHKGLSLSLTQEAVASAQALVEDGEFEDWFSQGKTDTMSKQWMKPCSSSPEYYVSDRRNCSLSPHPQTLVTVPAKDVAKSTAGTPAEKYRWKGSTQFQSSSSRQALSTDRRAFVAHRPTQSPRKHSAVKTTMSYLQHSSVAKMTKALENKSKFNTPTKKEAGSFSTPTKQVTCESSTFVTPFKKPEPTSTFKTPIRAVPVTDCDTDTADDPDDPGVSDLAMLEKMMSDENAPELDLTQPGAAEETTQVEVPSDVKKARVKAKVVQAQRIKAKREKGGTKPVMGNLLREKTSGPRVSLKHVTGATIKPQHYSECELYRFGVHRSTLVVTCESAESFRFQVAEYYGVATATEKESVLVGDGGLAIMDEKSTLGKEEFCNALLDMEGVEPKLVSRDWVFNHYRWIIWKLAAYEVTLPHYFASRCLKPDQVMLQLKYRYDREIDRSHRSALKKIYEKDDSPQKCMVLCVSRVIALNDNTATMEANKKGNAGGLLELTDGWYPIKAAVDNQLARIVRQGGLRVGDKIMVYGAELMGSQDGCLPLEAPADVMLKICTNSTRRVPWHTKLGYTRCPQPRPLALSSLYPDGGLIGCVDIVVFRVYPTMYLEKDSSGTSVFRSGRAEEKALKIFEKEKQKQQEAVFARLQMEFEQRSSMKDVKACGKKQWSSKEISELETECEIYEAYTMAGDANHFRSVLSGRQQSLLEDYKSKVLADQQAEMQADFQTRLLEARDQIPCRNVTPLLKVRVAGCANADIDTHSGSLYTIWRPSEEVISLFQEGHRLHMYNVMATELRGKIHGTGGCRSGLTASRTTRYKTVTIDDNLLDLVYEPREVVRLSELKGQLQPTCGELDIVGVVINITHLNHFQTSGGGDAQSTTVYFADGDFVGVKFWGGLSVLGLQDLLKIGVCLSCTNLTYREDFKSRIPCLVATELSLFTTNPRGKYLKTAVEKLQQTLQKNKSFVTESQDQLYQMMTLPKIPAIDLNRFNAGPKVSTPNSGRFDRHYHKPDGNPHNEPRDSNTNSLANWCSGKEGNRDLPKRTLRSVTNQSDNSVSNLMEQTSESHQVAITQDTVGKSVEADKMSSISSQTNSDSGSAKMSIKSSVQKSKAEKLDNFIDNMSQMVHVQQSPRLSFTPNLPTSVQKAFKPPGLRRRAIKANRADQTKTSLLKNEVSQRIDFVSSSNSNVDERNEQVLEETANRPDETKTSLLKNEVSQKIDFVSSSYSTVNERNEQVLKETAAASESISEGTSSSMDVDGYQHSTERKPVNIPGEMVTKQTDEMDTSEMKQRKGKRKKSATEYPEENLKNGKKRKSLRLSRHK